jgi:hypothetical protein
MKKQTLFLQFYRTEGFLQMQLQSNKHWERNPKHLQLWHKQFQLLEEKPLPG